MPPLRERIAPSRARRPDVSAVFVVSLVLGNAPSHAALLLNLLASSFLLRLVEVTADGNVYKENEKEEDEENDDEANIPMLGEKRRADLVLHAYVPCRLLHRLVVFLGVCACALN